MAHKRNRHPYERRAVANLAIALATALRRVERLSALVRPQTRKQLGRAALHVEKARARVARVAAMNYRTNRPRAVATPDAA